eukprot:GHVN01059704.1.p1 GENE.GHVN01059704.1~~GHVN01059704.1.p1  ORF type:complete len:106 (-),score=1.95 GHVN01059704.1:605-922(-)
MKVTFILTTAYLIYLMRVQPPISQTYDKNTDKFAYWLYLIPRATVLGVVTSPTWSVPEVRAFRSDCWRNRVTEIGSLTTTGFTARVERGELYTTQKGVPPLKLSG